MLLVVVGNITASSLQHPLHTFTVSIHRWVTMDGLSLFSKLSLCHAFLAKLSTRMLTSVTFEDKPLLLTIFSSVCDLFDGYSELTVFAIVSHLSC